MAIGDKCISLVLLIVALVNLWVKPEAYPRVEHLKGASLGLAPALPANIRLGCFITLALARHLHKKTSEGNNDKQSPFSIMLFLQFFPFLSGCTSTKLFKYFPTKSLKIVRKDFS
jgi:hypothetical protein